MTLLVLLLDRDTLRKVRSIKRERKVSNVQLLTALNNYHVALHALRSVRLRRRLRYWHQRAVAHTRREHTRVRRTPHAPRRSATAIET